VIKKIITGLTIVIIFSNLASACTTGLAASRATADQRPILWKNRDSSHEYNALKFFRYGDVKIMGIINSGDTTQIWAGINNHGFAIINAEARDMARENENTQYDDEGILMKEALVKCKTVQDFEKMLQSSNQKGQAVTSNFGVMDASGAVVFFETGNHNYYKFAGHDLFTNPEGFIVRSNFAVKGNRETRYGLERYLKAFRLFQKANCDNNLDAEYIISTVSPYISCSKDANKYKNLYKSINRRSSVSSAIFEGVSKDENPEMTTFWCNIGEPALCVALPIWVYSEKVPQKLNSRDSSAINELALKLKDYVYPDTSREEYMYQPHYKKIENTIQNIQKFVIKRTNKKLKEWQKNQPSRDQVAKFQKEMADKVYLALKNLVDNLYLQQF